MTAARPVALVTGASSAIGEAVSLALAAAGFDVVGASHDGSRVSPLGVVALVDLDVTGDAAVTTAVQRVVERFGRIDVLVNSAAIGPKPARQHGPVAQTQGDFDSNLFGLIRMTQAVLPYMRSRRSGRIINLPSIAGLITGPYLAAHRASKRAVGGYSAAVDHEVREGGVRVLLVEPGGIGSELRTDRTRSSTFLLYGDKRRRIVDQATPLVRAHDAAAVIAKTVVAAATDPSPKQRYVAALPGRRINALTCVVPSRIGNPQMFYATIRKYNQLPG